MAFEELREQFMSRLKDLGSQIQESPAFQSLKEKYDDLPSTQQRVLLAAMAAVVGFFAFSFPYDSYTQSQDSLTEFESRRDLIRDLLRVTKETSEAPAFPLPPPMGQIKTDMEMRLQQFQLIPEQIVGINVEMNKQSSLIPENRQEGALKVILRKLNLRQVVDVVSQLQTFHPTVKLANLIVDAHPADARYLDATLDFIVIKIPQITMETEEEPPANNRRRNNRGRN